MLNFLFCFTMHLGHYVYSSYIQRVVKHSLTFVFVDQTIVTNGRELLQAFLKHFRDIDECLEG